MRTFFIASAILVCVAAALVDACSWGNPVWPKDPRSDTPLFRFVVGVDKRAKTGYIDSSGNVVIPPSFDNDGDYGYDDFLDGIASVAIHRHYWYINSKGQRLFRNRNSGVFSEGFAEFKVGEKFGYLNMKGRVAIPPTFESADPFSEGLAPVQTGGMYGYINSQGRFTVKPSFALAFEFKNGFARVLKRSGCLYVGCGPCDAFNPIVLPLIGLRSPAITGKEPPCTYSFIDRTGRELPAASYRDAKDFSEQMAPVGDGSVWGFIDASGSIVIPLRFHNAESFSEGLAAVEIDHKWGYVNHSGKLVIAPVFSRAFPFFEGLALTINIGSQYEFIDKTGKRAIPGFFAGASSFVMGLAHVRSGEDHDTASWAYIDHRGHAVFRYNERGPLPR